MWTQKGGRFSQGSGERERGRQTLAFSLLVLFLSVIQRGGATGFKFAAVLLGGFCEIRLVKYKHESPHWLETELNCRGLA